MSASRYENPHTGLGVPLAGLARQGLTTFVIHEAGYLPHGLDWHFPSVRSPYWRLYYNHDPGWFVRWEARRFRLGPTTVVLIPAGATFDCVGNAGVSHLWLHFSPQHWFAEGTQAPCSVPLTPLMRAAISNTTAAHQAGQSDTRRARLYHAASALVHATFAQPQAPRAVTHPEHMQGLLTFIDENLAGDLENADLARRAAMSTEHFSRWFKSVVGSPPAVYVRRVRVRQAARILSLGNESIEDVAALCGFANRYHLSRVFSQQLGCGPAAFRRRYLRA